MCGTRCQISPFRVRLTRNEILARVVVELHFIFSVFSVLIKCKIR